MNVRRIPSLDNIFVKIRASYSVINQRSMIPAFRFEECFGRTDFNFACSDHLRQLADVLSLVYEYSEESYSVNQGLSLPRPTLVTSRETMSSSASASASASASGSTCASGWASVSAPWATPSCAPIPSSASILGLLKSELDPICACIAQYAARKDLQSLTNACHDTRGSVFLSLLFERTLVVPRSARALEQVSHVVRVVEVADLEEMCRARVLFPSVRYIRVRVAKHRTRVILDCVDRLEGIEGLDFEHCALGNFHHLARLRSLQDLTLRYCNVLPSPVAESWESVTLCLAGFTELRRLHIHDHTHDYYHTDYSALGALKQLECVCIWRGYRVDLDIFADLPRLVSLELLDVGLKATDRCRVLSPSLEHFAMRLANGVAHENEGQIFMNSFRCASHTTSLAIPLPVPLKTFWITRRFIPESVSSLFGGFDCSRLIHLDLLALFVYSVVGIEECSNLRKLGVSLFIDENSPYVGIGLASSLRCLTRLQALACQNLAAADFLDSLCQLEDLQVWSMRCFWSRATLRYMFKYYSCASQSQYMPSVPPSVEIYALRKLLRLSLLVAGRDGYLDRAWLNCIVTECVRLTRLEIRLLESYNVTLTLDEGTTRLEALVRLEEFVASRVTFADSASIFLCLPNLRVLTLLYWPPEFDLSPLYRVGLPRLRCLVLSRRMDCFGLKSFDRLEKTLPALEEILHPEKNCRRKPGQCAPRVPDDYRLDTVFTCKTLYQIWLMNVSYVGDEDWWSPRWD